MRGISSIHVWGVLNSCGGVSVSARISLGPGTYGEGICPAAIAPGRHEHKRSELAILGEDCLAPTVRRVRAALTGVEFESQRQFDMSLNHLEREFHLGTDLKVALSIAFCRASSQCTGIPVHVLIANMAGVQPMMPRLLVNVFSGGIHAEPGVESYCQQIMVCPKSKVPVEATVEAMHVYGRMEGEMRANGQLAGYSASSGMLIRGQTTEELLDKVARSIAEGKLEVELGVDVAAEHLVHDSRYLVEGAMLSSEEMFDHYRAVLCRHRLAYIEDPFDAADADQWERLTRVTRGTSVIVGDDLFATDAERIRKDLSSGVLLKINQVGTISGLVDAAERAAALGMTTCVSHRSCETEDSFVCDLAFGLGAEFLKLGGPRRADRTAKFNRLIRLASWV